MGGFDEEHLGMMGDWMVPNPSPTPRTFLASLLGEDIGLRSLTEDAETDNKTGLEQPSATVNTDENGDQVATSNAVTEEKMRSRGSLVDRMAARAGSNAPRINTETIRSSESDLMQSQEVGPPYLTIPSGLSPTSLLDSPVFLSNSLAQPSPTTGKYVFGSSSGLGAPDVNVDNCFEGINTSFTFKPVEESRPSLFMGETTRTFTNTEVAEKSGLPFVSPCVVLSQHDNHQQTDVSISTSMKDSGCEARSSHTISSADDQQDEDVEQRAIADYCVGSGPAEDGYNWRKYGQKQVKGSEYPRSYYKCTHPNCPVKKKVERSHEGHITEIIYTGAHNHPKPPPSRRSALGSSMQLDNVEQTTQNGNGSPSLDNFEVTSSANLALALEYGNGDRSCALSIDEDDEEDDRNALESESKRRKVEMSGASRAIREPRVVVQTTSEVDILDDGYRWRKYGQKVVKGNPNPRSYYKCTSAGCTVRKHVERASNDLKSVITTYEGKHNHDVPAARNSSTHINSLSTQVTSALHRPEPSQIHNNMRPFQRPSFSLPWSSLSHGLGVAINHQGLANFSMPGMGQGAGIFNDHPHRMDDMAGFMLPRGEPKLEPIYEPQLDSTSSSAYRQLMNRLSRGPQM